MLGSHLDGSRDLHSGQGRITQIFPSERIGGILLEAIRDLTVAVLRREKDISAQISRGGWKGRFCTRRSDRRSERQGRHGVAEAEERDQDEHGYRL